MNPKILLTVVFLSLLIGGQGFAEAQSLSHKFNAFELKIEKNYPKRQRRHWILKQEIRHKRHQARKHRRLDHKWKPSWQRQARRYLRGIAR